MIEEFQQYESDTDFQLSNQRQLISHTADTNSLIHGNGNLSQLIRNFNKMNTKEIEQITNKNNFDIIVNEIIDIFNKLVGNSEKQKLLNHLKNYDITSQDFYDWLMNNQNNSDSIVVLGEFNYFGIGTGVPDQQKAFELWQKAADLENAL